MKFFFWDLNPREKFIRVIWTGIIVWAFLMYVVWISSASLTFRVGILIFGTTALAFDIIYRYRKMKKAEGQLNES